LFGHYILLSGVVTANHNADKCCYDVNLFYILLNSIIQDLFHNRHH
jgi:hypothetical protein